MRVYVYVDGFNLYYRALKGTRHKWLDLSGVARRLLDANDTVEKIRYFTARVSARAGDPDAPRRQQILLSALQTIPNLEIHYGRFLAKTKRRPLVSNARSFVEVHDTEEKGSDVNLAVHLLNDAWMKRFELALVLSQDTDLVEPIRMVRENIGVPVGLVWLDGGRPGSHLANAASFVRHLRAADLAASQFSDPVVRPDGSRISKPPNW
jgi:hypothetical protein